MAVQYLESLDSVRTGPGSGISDEDARLAELQTFLEVLMALALGREIVVPQPYAFDSGAFLRVAHRVLNARPKESEDRPFRPHLFGPGVEDFDDAIRSMLRRVHDPERPFHSSLHPALQEMSPEQVDRVVQDLDKGLPRVTGDAFARPLKTVMEEFRLTRPYVVPGPGAGLRLDAVLGDLVSPRSRLSSVSEGLLGAQREVYERLRSAVRSLGHGSPAAFGQRSRLRQDVPWPNDPDRLSAAEIVGNRDLPLVIEFVDTLYNRVIADSMGRPLALYSTAATADDVQLEARYLAQELALGRPPLVDDEGDPELPPYFQVAHRTSGSRTEGLLVRDLQEVFEQGSQALGPLMAERGRPGSRFWRGIAQIDDAAARRDRKSYAKALDSHLAHVGQLLVGEVDIGWRADAGIFLMVKAGEKTLEIAEPTGVPSMAVEGAAYVLERVTRKTYASVTTRGARRRLASAIGSIVPPAFPQRRP